VATILGGSGGYTLTVISAIIFCINSSFTDIPVLYFVFFCVCVYGDAGADSSLVFF
jgi:hypothetical protein